MNSAAMNIGVHVSFRIIVFSGYMPRSMGWALEKFLAIRSSLNCDHYCIVIVGLIWKIDKMPETSYKNKAKSTCSDKITFFFGN